MKMHAIIVKQGFAVIGAFCYNVYSETLFILKPCNNDLEVAGCEDCV